MKDKDKPQSLKPQNKLPSWPIYVTIYILLPADFVSRASLSRRSQVPQLLSSRATPSRVSHTRVLYSRVFYPRALSSRVSYPRVLISLESCNRQLIWGTIFEIWITIIRFWGMGTEIWIILPRKYIGFCSKTTFSTCFFTRFFSRTGLNTKVRGEIVFKANLTRKYN